MGIKGYFSTMRERFTPLTLDQIGRGVVFIDGHIMAHQIANMVDPGSRYDMRGVAMKLEELFNCWIGQHKWDIQLVLFDGLVPTEKMDSRRKRAIESLPTALHAQSLALTVLCGALCLDTIQTKFPGVPCLVSPGEADPDLACLVFNYATMNPNKAVHIISNDSGFCAFDFPENVHIVNTLVGGLENSVLYALPVSRTVANWIGVKPTLLAYSVMKHSGKGPSQAKKYEQEEGYIEFSQQQQQLLAKANYASVSEYLGEPITRRAYQIFGQSHDELLMHTAANAWIEYGYAYVLLPVMCEPKEYEYAFDAGRRWRSVAYEICAQRLVQVFPEKDFVKSHVREFVRIGETLGEMDVPIRDSERTRYNSTGSHYQLFARDELLRAIKTWKTSDLINAIWIEISATSPNIRNTKLEFDAHHMRDRVLRYLKEAWNDEGVFALRRYSRKERKLMARKSCAMDGTDRRFYNKLLACLQSLRMLQAVGVKFPVDVHLFDLDGTRWMSMTANKR